MRFIALISFLIFSFNSISCPALANTKLAKNKQFMLLEQSIELSGELEDIFAFAANPVNDHYWRTEVKNMELDGPFEVGSILTETACLPLNPNFITITVISELVHNSFVVVESLEGDTYFRVERHFKEIPGGVLMTYSLKADVKMLKDILGFPMPLALAKTYYGAILKLYVNNLKRFVKNKDLSEF